MLDRVILNIVLNQHFMYCYEIDCLISALAQLAKAKAKNTIQLVT